MSEHVHLWVHRETLGGNVIEKCTSCRRARRPRLSSAMARENELAAINAVFRAVYAPRIADMVPPPFFRMSGVAHVR